MQLVADEIDHTSPHFIQILPVQLIKKQLFIKIWECFLLPSWEFVW